MTPELLEAWNDFVQSRTEIKKPLTPIAIKKLKNKLNVLSHGNDRLAIAILDQSSERGWLGIFPLNEQNAELFRVSEMSRRQNKVQPCEYCQKPISESQRYDHQQVGVCPGWKEAPKQEVLEAIDKLGRVWGRN